MLQYIKEFGLLAQVIWGTNIDQYYVSYLPLLSVMHFSTLQSSFGLMSIITPLLFVEPWLKKILPPHSADQVSALGLELCVS